MSSQWYIVNGRGEYLVIGALHSRHHDVAFVEDETRTVAEPFAHYHHARDMVAWLGLTDVRFYDYAPSRDPGKLHVPDHVPTTKELFERALVEDRPRYFERLRNLFTVKHQ